MLSPRIGALCAGSVATALLVVVGCTGIVDGTAKVDAGEAPVYRASVSASVEASATTSSSREAERQESLTTAAIHSACETLSTSSVDAIKAVNDYVSTFNNSNTESQVVAKAGPAVDLLNRSADLVSASMTAPLSTELRDALKGWINSARAVATAIAGNGSTGEFNSAVSELNDAKTRALALCDKAYR